MMGAYFKGPFTNFDFLDPFQTPRHPISVRWRRIAMWGLTGYGLLLSVMKRSYRTGW